MSTLVHSVSGLCVKETSSRKIITRFDEVEWKKATETHYSEWIRLSYYTKRYRIFGMVLEALNIPQKQQMTQRLSDSLNLVFGTLLFPQCYPSFSCLSHSYAFMKHEECVNKYVLYPCHGVTQMSIFQYKFRLEHTMCVDTCYSNNTRGLPRAYRFQKGFQTARITINDLFIKHNDTHGIAF